LIDAEGIRVEIGGAEVAVERCRLVLADGLDQHNSGVVHTDSHNVRETAAKDYIRIRHELD
jgi:hypothetical protein